MPTGEVDVFNGALEGREAPATEAECVEDFVENKRIRKGEVDGTCEECAVAVHSDRQHAHGELGALASLFKLDEDMNCHASSGYDLVGLG